MRKAGCVLEIKKQKLRKDLERTEKKGEGKEEVEQR